MDVLWTKNRNEEETHANCCRCFNDTVVRAENVLCHGMLRAQWGVVTGTGFALKCSPNSA